MRNEGPKDVYSTAVKSLQPDGVQSYDQASRHHVPEGTYLSLGEASYLTQMLCPTTEQTLLEKVLVTIANSAAFTENQVL